MWSSADIRSNLQYLVPTLLPLVFLLANAVAKLLAGQRQHHFFGSDMALCGCALFTGTLLRQLLIPGIPDPTVIAFAILQLLGFTASWAFCIWLASRKRWGISLISASIGTATFSLCSNSAWGMLTLSNKP